MDTAKKYLRFNDALQEYAGKTAAWLSFLLVLVICIDVFTRYLLSISFVALQELEWHLFAVIFLLAAGYTLRNGEHVRIDVFYQRYSERTRHKLNLWGSALLLIPFAWVMIYYSYDFLMASVSVGERSPEAAGLPARYILRGVIPLSMIVLIFEGLAQVTGSFIWLKENGGE